MLPFPIDSEFLLRAGLHALAAGEGAALRYVHEQANVVLDEIDDVAMRESQSELPATAEQLIDEIDDPHGETDVALLSPALGVADNCSYRNATVVGPFGFSEAAIHHYGLSGDKADRVCERFQEFIVGSGVDIGGRRPQRLLTLCGYAQENPPNKTQDSSRSRSSLRTRPEATKPGSTPDVHQIPNASLSRYGDTATSLP